MMKKFVSRIDHSNTTANPVNMKVSIVKKQPAFREDFSKRPKKIKQLLKAVRNEVSAYEKETKILKKEALIARKIISLSKPQIQAFRTMLNETLASDRKKTLLLTVLINTFFFVLTLIMEYVIQHYLTTRS